MKFINKKIKFSQLYKNVIRNNSTQVPTGSPTQSTATEDSHPEVSSGPPTFYEKDLKFFKTTKFHLKPKLNTNIEFGVHVSDHMLEIDYADSQWSRPVISEFHNLSLDPTNSTLHYAISAFGGKLFNKYLINNRIKGS